MSSTSLPLLLTLPCVFLARLAAFLLTFPASVILSTESRRPPPLPITVLNPPFNSSVRATGIDAAFLGLANDSFSSKS